MIIILVLKYNSKMLFKKSPKVIKNFMKIFSKEVITSVAPIPFTLLQPPEYPYGQDPG